MTGQTVTAPGVFGQEVTYNSWWPEGNKTENDNPSTPKTSIVAITRGGAGHGSRSGKRGRRR